MNIRNGIDTAENQLNDAEDKLYLSMNADEIDFKKMRERKLMWRTETNFRQTALRRKRPK